MSSFLAALLIAQGVVTLPVRVEDQDGNVKAIPGPKPVLVIYEDQEGGKENLHAKDVIGRLNTPPANRAFVDVLPVADLEKWNWWPARKHALAEIQKTARDKRTTIFIDWSGAGRRAWGLAKKRSALVLVGTDGRVLFSSEGELPPARLEALVALLRGFGMKP